MPIRWCGYTFAHRRDSNLSHAQRTVASGPPDAIARTYKGMFHMHAHRRPSDGQLRAQRSSGAAVVGQRQYEPLADDDRMRRGGRGAGVGAGDLLAIVVPRN
jgi:hypothetical protein